jgi:hypothetical protein
MQTAAVRKKGRKKEAKAEHRPYNSMGFAPIEL